jgi:hypothetical protein
MLVVFTYKYKTNVLVKSDGVWSIMGMTVLTLNKIALFDLLII